MVSEEMDSEWRRLGPAEASETYRERVRGQGARRMKPFPPRHAETASANPLHAQICCYPQVCSPSLKLSPPTSRPVPKPHPHP